MHNPLEQKKDDYESVINKIKSNSAVGIDAQYTHAIIIEYLQQISKRLDHLQDTVQSKQK